MPPDKCILDPERDCLGLIKSRELEQDLNELRKQNSSSHERLFDRLNELEKQEAVQKVQFETILDKLGALSSNMAELREESKVITEKLPALSHKVEALEKQSASMDNDVSQIKEKPAKTWEHIKTQSLGWIVALVLTILAVALGLGKYL